MGRLVVRWEWCSCGAGGGGSSSTGVQTGLCERCKCSLPVVWQHGVITHWQLARCKCDTVTSPSLYMKTPYRHTRCSWVTRGRQRGSWVGGESMGAAPTVCSRFLEASVPLPLGRAAVGRRRVGFQKVADEDLSVLRRALFTLGFSEDSQGWSLVAAAWNHSSRHSGRSRLTH